MTAALTPDDVHAISVGQLFRDDADVYSIPLYQRDYTWGEEQIHRLLYDILDEAERGDPKDYFLGNLVVAPPIPSDGSSQGVDPADPFDVIDGQQRLTCLYILLTTLSRTPGFEDQIGSLQPLTYESRPMATRVLRGVASGASSESDGADVEDSAILRAGRIIQQLLADPEFAGRFLNARVIDYLLHRVLLVRMPIDRSMDLNRYFEIMNTRGAQLSQVDIVKARLLRKLPDPRDSAVLTRVWTACSDMDNYVAMTVAAGDTDLRARLFGSEWTDVPPADFASLRAAFAAGGDGGDGDSFRGPAGPDPDGTAATADSGPLSLSDAIDAYSRHGIVSEVEDDAENERFTSQITFPTFLLHVLAVRRPDGTADRDDKQLDDKELVHRFSTTMADVVDGTDWVRGFTTDLLRIRFLFDRYVLKRDSSISSQHESTTDSEPGGWSLTRLVRGESRSRGKRQDSPRYPRTFGSDDRGSGQGRPQQRILLLQSALRITYTSPRTMHWMTDVLRYVTELADRGQEVPAQGLLDTLDTFAVERVAAAIDPDVTKADLGEHGFPVGFGIPRIVFTYLDYLLVLEWGRWDFRFSYRTSIEHFSPRTVDTDYVPVGAPTEGPRLLDYFGNLALVTVSTNSKFSNQPPKHKADSRAAREQSLKLELMADRAAESGDWTDAEIKVHHDDMVTLLRDALARRR